MRPGMIAAPLAAGLALSGCAALSSPDRFRADMDRLDRECAARGGVLTPTGAQTGYPARDFACRIGEAASRLEPSR